MFYVKYVKNKHKGIFYLMCTLDHNESTTYFNLRIKIFLIVLKTHL